VSGRVQGVFFRAATAKKARELGIVGHAHNLDDGTVEVLAVGPPERLQELRDWLGVGPPAASVSGVDSETVKPPVPPPSDFSTA